MAHAGAGVPATGLVREYGMSNPTFYAWKNKHGGLSALKLRKMRQIDDANRRLTKLVADLSLDKQILQDVLINATAAAKPTW